MGRICIAGSCINRLVYRYIGTHIILLSQYIGINTTTMTRTYGYTAYLSPVYLVRPDDDGSGDVDLVTSNLSHTFYVSNTAIAEYSPTLMVNVPDNSRTVVCPHSDGMTGPICKTVQLSMCMINHNFLPVSEQNGTVDDLFSVDVNSSCYSIVTCSPMEPIQECTAYCGPSDDVTALTTNRSSTDTGSGTITIQLPPATGGIYHCVVSGSRDDGTVVFRGRQQQTVKGE